MPHVIEAPAITEESQELPSYEVGHAEPVSESGFARIIAAIGRKIAARRRQRSHWGVSNHRAPETAVDMLARKYPYIYIKAMSG